MQTDATSAAVCPECGTRLEGAFSPGLGRCMICLLRVGFNDAEVPDEKLFAPVTDRLGNYRIERGDDGTAWELGRGAMGVTYRAIDTSLQRPVALKLIASEWVKRGAEARERFMREARTAAALRHPNVATVYHFGIREENGQCFCAMELVEGETLEMRVRRTGPLDALTTIDIALQVSSAAPDPDLCEHNIPYTGTFDWFAANGDEIYGTFEGYLCPTETPGIYDNHETAEITGGTGRFANATGHFELGGQLDFTTTPPSFVLPWEGVISRLGPRSR